MIFRERIRSRTSRLSDGIIGIAFVPMTPLMFRHLSGTADPLEEARAAAVAAVGGTCAGALDVVVLCPVGGREAPGDWRDPSRSGAVHGEPRSLAEQVGGHLLDLAGVDLPVRYVECTDGEPMSDFLDLLAPTCETAVIVLGDGAAARSQGAPGHIDERSFAFDDAVAASLESGDGESLAGLDATLAVELMVTGRHTWPVIGWLVPRGSGWLGWRGDPLGLTYFVAVWRP
ncbi:hypothetical protein [Nocardioides cavernaquae]|uniref:Catalytic LigB subunit of aromatic ring-opening dioxygenase n=1 Tax=Nocardioides cavernaquae TaxID=2321396 RepID=A0A3A5H659_9ACTN|nr:hypothetical protein [Nocardioides cavernaquae]RJS46176.1 hypothetical protein D4739_08105 [Nocardioides cavernaquae]